MVKTILELNDMTNLEKLIDKYNLCVNDGLYLLDGDLEDLFSDSGIVVGQSLFKAKDFKYDEDTYEPIDCNYGDYLETIELTQNNETYLCQVFVMDIGCGADYGLKLENIYLEEKCDENIRKES